MEAAWLPGISFAAGAVFGAANLALWKGVVGLLASGAVGTAVTGRSVVIVSLFFVKLPVFVALAMWVQQLPEPAPSWFVAGLCVVYFALVGWAVARR